MKNVLIINGSLGGRSGNTGALLDIAASLLGSKANVSQLTLREPPCAEGELGVLRASDAFVFGTGTYWDSWGSPLQAFLERMTPTEGTDIWMGKPAAVIVSMNSVGGKGVLSRLQGVLNTFGLTIPPMSGLVYSLVNQLALQGGNVEETADLWRPEDLELVMLNLLAYCVEQKGIRPWPVDRSGFDKKWFVAPSADE